MAEIKGQVRVANGLVAANLPFTFYRERFGAEPEAIAQARAAPDGTYVVPDVEVEPHVTLVARVAREGQDDVVLTPLRPQQELSAMHLVLPLADASVASEYQRLKDAVEPVLQGRSLATAQERGDRRDLTLVHRESGWDARLVAVAALSARLTEPANGQPAGTLDEQAVYGLLRAGLPSHAAALARVPAATVRAALDKSAAAGVIDLDEAGRADAVTAFESFARAERLAARPAGGLSTMAELLDATGLSADGDDSPRARFEQVVLDTRNAEPLWKRAADAGIDDESIKTLRTQSKLAFLTTNNAPLMSRVAGDLAADASLGTALVANRFDDQATWTTALDEIGGAAAVPAAFGGEENPVGAYSSELARRVRVAYPTHVVAAMVQRDELPIAVGGLNAEVASTLLRAADSGFRLGANHVASFVSENAAVFDGVDPSDQPAVANAISTLQRVYQLSPSNASMKVLMEQGLTSAYDIVAMPEQSFVDRYGWLFPSEREARLVHRKSEQVSAVLYNFYSMTKQASAAPSLVAVSGTAERQEESLANIRRVLPATPTMESLFGSMDYCECDHCRSVLGPAAYLVDLLKFLDPDELVWEGFKADWAKRHGGEPYPHDTPYEELRKRRPDLARLALSCENTNVELPVIDLVNEILEFLVGSPPGVPDAARDSGAVDSADVMAEPEFSIDAAYEKLRESSYPAVLPFDLWHETVRAFVGWLDDPLADLLDVFDAGGADDSGRYAAAIERLGLTRAEADVLDDADPLAAWWTRAGFAAAADQEAVAVATLGRAKQLARRLGVSYQELADLLGTHLVNPGLAGLGVLVTAGVSVADAIFWRANRALAASDDPMTEPARTTWLTVRSVQERLDTVTRSYGLSGDRAADEWLAALPDAAFDGVVVLVDPDASCDFDRTIVGSAATGSALAADALAELFVKLDLFVRLRRATGWGLADLDAALRAFVPGGTAGTTMFGAPVRAALVHLSRAVQVERLLGTDGCDRRRVVSLWSDLSTNGPRPLYPELFLGRPVGQQDASFVAPLGDVLSAAAVGAGEVALARAHGPALQGALGLRVDELQAVADRAGAAWDALPLGLAEVSSFHRYAFLADSLGWTVGDVLTLQRLSGIDPFASLAADPLAVPPAGTPLASPHATLEFVRLAQRVAASGLTPAEIAYLAEHRVDPDGGLAPDEAATTALLDALRASVGEALAKLAAAPPAGEPVPNTPHAPTPERVVAAIVAATVGPRGGVVAALLHGDDALADPTVADGAPELVQAFIAMAAAAADPARAQRAHLLLSKVLLVADRLGLTAHECTVLGLGALPLALVDGVPPAFTLVAEALHHVELRRTTRAPQDALADVVAAARTAGLDDAAAALATATRRTAEVVTATAAALGVDAAALATPAGVGRLWTVLALIERVGVPVATVAGWLAIADPATTPVERRRIARSVKEAVRAHLGPVRWRQVAKPVSDRLRQRQRDALVAAVLHAKGLTSVEELYQELLIDPGSEPVLRTTRIRQAISTCQLFIQRCLLNIEPNVHPSAINAEHWEWMKRYRVWEANRKIFLYPENWLEPEFRDDKSHLFAELESTLLQNDVTADVVEDAFLVYLRKLDEIARLDVAGFYIEQDALDPGSTTLHVIGRTHGGPHQYFYRRMQHGMWTPWEPMGVDIEGDHIVPVVWRDRLHVFWVTFLQKADVSDSEPSSGDMQLVRAGRFESGGFGFAAGGGVQVVTAASKPPPSLAEAKVSDVRQGTASGGVNRLVEVQLNWSEYLNGAWSPKTSGGFGSVPPHRTSGVFDPASTFVHGSVLWADGEEVGVQVHLTGSMTRTFLLRGRNSVPEPGTSSSPPVPPYNAAEPSVNRYSGSGALTVSFAQKFTSVDGGAETATNSTLGILGSCGGYSVLPAANGISIGGGDIGSLVSPFFFQDARRTFYVEPSLLETTTETWEEWIVPDPEPGITFDPGIIEQQSVVPFVPELLVPVEPDDTDPLFDPWEDLYFHQPQDFLTSPDVGVLYDDTVLGSRGGVDLTIVSAFEGRQIITNGIASNGTISQNVIPVFTGRVRDTVTRNVGGETSLVADQVVLVDHVALQNAGLSASGTLRVVGRNGLVNSDTDLELGAVVLRNNFR